MKRVFGVAVVLMVVICGLTVAHASNGALWIGVGKDAPIGAEFHHVLGPIGFAFSSGDGELPSPDPSVSETSLKETETLLSAFYEHEFGPLSAGIGAVHLSRKQTGRKTVIIDGDPQLVSVSVLDDTTTSLAAIVRAVFDAGPIIGDAQALVTSKGVIWSAKAGYETDRLRIGVGYRGGPTNDWWSGPLVFVGTRW